jgi:hypothetical protein
MAFGTIKPEFLHLYDKWPGPVNPNMGLPEGGFNGKYSNDVTNPVYPVGSKVMVYTDSSYAKGWSTLMYAAFAEGTNMAVGIQTDNSLGNRICVHSESTAALLDCTVPPWWVLTNCASKSDCTSGGPGAIACFSLDGDAAYYPVYGWFWVGGPCPVNDVPRFKTTLAGAATNGFLCSSVSNASFSPGAQPGVKFVFGAGTSICVAVVAMCNTLVGCGEGTTASPVDNGKLDPNGIIFCGSAVSG